MEKTSSRRTEKILMGAAFAFYFLVTSYKLTNSPLWLDEAIEFWYSRFFVGRIPFTDTTNMYERIVATYQPPLYNFLMYFWLKISTGEYWFRFFGVVMGLIGNIAVYKTVKKTGNGILAAAAVIFSTCFYQLVSFWQECAEYCLMLGTLCWTLYFFVSLLEEQSRKNIILFTISAVLPIYSQYGAVFPVASMLIIAFIYILCRKEKKAIIEISLSYILALVFAGLPLLFLFLFKQLAAQSGGTISPAKISVGFRTVFDMWYNLGKVVKWSLFPGYDTKVSAVFMIGFVLIAAAVLIFSKKTGVRLLVVMNIAVWVSYYFAVQSGLYAYGAFGNRYCLFFIPVWVVSMFFFGHELNCIIMERFPEKSGICDFGRGICCCMILCFAVFNWTAKIEPNWQKDNMREAVRKWNGYDVRDCETLVYYGGVPCFAYYVRTLPDFSPEMETHIRYQEYVPDQSEEEYFEYIKSLFEGELPAELYFIGSHVNEDMETMISVFTDRGYSCEELFSYNDARLYKLESAL